MTRSNPVNSPGMRTLPSTLIVSPACALSIAEANADADETVMAPATLGGGSSRYAVWELKVEAAIEPPPAGPTGRADAALAATSARHARAAATRRAESSGPLPAEMLTDNEIGGTQNAPLPHLGDPTCTCRLMAKTLRRVGMRVSSHFPCAHRHGGQQTENEPELLLILA